MLQKLSRKANLQNNNKLTIYININNRNINIIMNMNMNINIIMNMNMNMNINIKTTNYSHHPFNTSKTGSHQPLGSRKDHLVFIIRLGELGSVLHCFSVNTIQMI